VLGLPGFRAVVMALCLGKVQRRAICDVVIGVSPLQQFHRHRFIGGLGPCSKYGSELYNPAHLFSKIPDLDSQQI
jgi:hypothetical protein